MSLYRVLLYKSGIYVLVKKKKNHHFVFRYTSTFHCCSLCVCVCVLFVFVLIYMVLCVCMCVKHHLFINVFSIPLKGEIDMCFVHDDDKEI